MAGNREPDIIAFDSRHRAAVRKLACDTALLGDSLDFCFGDREVLGDVLTLYFTDYEPESCFVAVKESEVVGYVTGARSTLQMNRVLRAKILPRIIVKILLRGTLLRRNAARFLFHAATSYFGGEFSDPPEADQFPATLHVNVDENWRRTNTGTRLMERCLEFLRHEKVTGVRVSTMSMEARSFFERLGFTLLFEGKRSFLKYCLGRDLPLFTLGKRLG